MYASMMSETSMKMSHFRSKTRSLGQIIDKACVCSRGIILSLIPMKHDQNVCFDEILDEFEIGSCWVKNISEDSENGSCWQENLVTRSNLRKTLRTLLRPHFWFNIIKLGQNICLEISTERRNGLCWIKHLIKKKNLW